MDWVIIHEVRDKQTPRDRPKPQNKRARATMKGKENVMEWVWGEVEGACRHLVKDRMEGSGMRWTVAGAEAVLKLRAVHLNGNWDSFWTFHMQQEAERRFGARTWDALPRRDRQKAVA